MLKRSIVLSFFLCASTVQISQASDTCQLIKGVPGPEDFAVEYLGDDNLRLLISSQERREPGNNSNGGLFVTSLVHPNLTEAQPMDIIGLNGPFHPHGIDLIQEADNTTLYVINHHSPGIQRIEVFKVNGLQLTHIKSLSDTTYLLEPNDLVALPGGELYVSNDHLKAPSVGTLLGDLFRRKKSNLVHYKDGAWSIAASGIAYANGVEVNEDGSKLYLAGVRENTVRSYDRDISTGELTENAMRFKLADGPDNLMWQDSDNLIVAAHPSSFKFVKHVKTSDNHSPSAIHRLNVKTGESSELFRDNGRVIDASSTGWVYKNRLFISQVFDDEVASCPLTR